MDELEARLAHSDGLVAEMSQSASPARPSRSSTRAAADGLEEMTAAQMRATLRRKMRVSRKRKKTTPKPALTSQERRAAASTLDRLCSGEVPHQERTGYPVCCLLMLFCCLQQLPAAAC